MWEDLDIDTENAGVQTRHGHKARREDEAPPSRNPSFHDEYRLRVPDDLLQKQDIVREADDRDSAPFILVTVRILLGLYLQRQGLFA